MGGVYHVTCAEYMTSEGPQVLISLDTLRDQTVSSDYSKISEYGCTRKIGLINSPKYCTPSKFWPNSSHGFHKFADLRVRSC